MLFAGRQHGSVGLLILGVPTTRAAGEDEDPLDLKPRPGPVPRRGRRRPRALLRESWSDIVTRRITDDTLPEGPLERSIEYHAPFDRCDRERGLLRGLEGIHRETVMTGMAGCPVCGLHQQQVEVSDGGNRMNVRCERCGFFEITSGAAQRVMKSVRAAALWSLRKHADIVMRAADIAHAFREGLRRGKSAHQRCQEFSYALRKSALDIPDCVHMVLRTLTRITLPRAERAIPQKRAPPWIQLATLFGSLSLESMPSVSNGLASLVSQQLFE